MSAIPYKADQLAESAAAFAEKITPAKDRWAYCFDRASYVYNSKRFGSSIRLNERTLPVCDRVLGIYAGSSAFRLRKIKALGLDGAFAWDAEQPRLSGKSWFHVGPMQAWHVGHLYFARVDSHPHVVKIGFSRRVRERFEDIESKCKTKLTMRPGEIRVGTLADEHWWHRNWADKRIAGEWFFDPHMSDRTLPHFLADHAKAEAA